MLIMALGLFATGVSADNYVKVGDLWYQTFDDFYRSQAWVIAPKDNSTYSGDIVIPDAIEVEGNYQSYYYSVTGILGQAFQGCSDLTVHLPKTIKSITPNVFQGCSGVTLVIDDLHYLFSLAAHYTRTVTGHSEIVPSEEKLMEGVEWLEMDGQRLTSIEIPDDIAIVGDALRGYDKLVSLTLPASLRSFSGYACFQGCQNLTSIYMKQEAPIPIPYHTFEDISPTCVLYVPKGTKDDYMEMGWNEEVFGGGVMETDQAPVVTGVGIVKKNFPDANLRKHLRSLVAGMDNIFTEDEIASITEINCGQKGIESLEGINLFTNLSTLDCSGNMLVELDLKAMSSLTSLNCNSCQLTLIDLSKFPNLQQLRCGGNKLTSLDVSCCPLLKRLHCHSNQLTELDLSALSNLWELYCYSNAITSLDLTKASMLEFFYCSDNPLGRLDLTENLSLKTLGANNCQLTELLLPTTDTFKELICMNNKLESLDLTHFPKLSTLKCSDNSLRALDLTNNTKLKVLETDRCQLTELLLPQSSTLEKFYCQCNQLESLNVSGLQVVSTIYCANNKISGEKMSELVESLRSFAVFLYGSGDLYLIDADGDGNTITNTQLQTARSKKWNVWQGDIETNRWFSMVPEDDTPTAIETPHLEAGDSGDHDTIYNLSGQRLHRLQTGLNIVNGKKVWVR